MKFTQLAFLTTLATGLVSGQGISLEDINPIDDVDSNVEGTTENNALPSIGLNITYNIEDRPESLEETGMPISFDQDETVMLNYTVVNNEDSDFSVIGVSGNILSYPSGELVTKISFGEMDNLYAKPNDILRFRQKVVIDLEPGLYYLFPLVHVTNETAVAIVERDSTRLEDEDVNPKPMSVAATPTILSIEEPLMSIFNPQFLSIQLLGLVAIGGISYYYLNKNKSTSKKNQKSEKKDPKEWLPEQYKK